MGHGRRLTSDIGGIYAAALDPARWPSVLEELGREFKSGVAGLQLRVREGEVKRADLVGVPPEIMRRIRTNTEQNPWVRITQPWFKPGDVVALDDCVPLSRLERTDYYQEILKPIEMVHCLGACVTRRGDEVLSFTMVRHRGAGAFQPRELRGVVPLLPHLRNALRVNDRLAALDQTHRVLADALDALRHGVLVVDGLGRVVFANRAANRILGEADGLTLRSNEIWPARPAERNRLRMLLHDAIHGEAPGASGGSLTISRPSLRQPYALLVTPLRLPLDGAEPRGAATLFISDPTDVALSPLAVFAGLFGLSPREAELAAGFVRNGDLRSTAESLGITPDTARWHLKRMYRKTGTTGQAGLMRRLAGGLGSCVALSASIDEALP